MIITVLFCLYYDSIIPSWVFILMLAKEVLTIDFTASIVKKYKHVSHSNYSGKLANILFYISMSIVVFSKTNGKDKIYIAVISALYSLINYFMDS